VLVGSERLARVSKTELDGRASGWTMDGAFVIVKHPDSPDGLTVRIERPSK
jgi:hypothetical protein